MTSRNSMRQLVYLCLPILAIGTAFSFVGDRTADAANPPSDIINSRARFQGVDANANFQAALEDALAQADAHFARLGADIRYNYRVVNTTGQRGGFVFYNDIFVTIEASGG
ncbi:MAG: hypothetical protein AB7N71_04390 [Phycisphaerae bacterium]